MSDDLIIVVPPGTRIRYVETPGISEVYAVDAHVLEHKPHEYMQWLMDPLALRIPMHDAVRYGP